MSEIFPVSYAAYVKHFTGEDDAFCVNCVDIPAALDLLKADLNNGNGATKDYAVLIKDCYIEYEGTTIIFTPTDDLDKEDNSGTLAIYFGKETPLSKRQSIELYIDDFNNLIANEGEIIYEPIR